MIDIVPGDDIEQIVGVTRHRRVHYGRAVSAQQQMYVLHSGECRDTVSDLRTCPYSLALVNGIDERDWSGREDVPVELAIRGDRLVPAVR